MLTNRDIERKYDFENMKYDLEVNNFAINFGKVSISEFLEILLVLGYRCAFNPISATTIGSFQRIFKPSGSDERLGVGCWYCCNRDAEDYIINSQVDVKEDGFRCKDIIKYLETLDSKDDKKREIDSSQIDLEDYLDGNLANIIKDVLGEIKSDNKVKKVIDDKDFGQF